MIYIGRIACMNTSCGNMSKTRMQNIMDSLVGHTFCYPTIPERSIVYKTLFVTRLAETDTPLNGKLTVIDGCLTFEIGDLKIGYEQNNALQYCPCRISDS